MSVQGFHTGPTIVGRMAEKCREAGLSVTCEGTERVYVDVPDEHGLQARHWVLACLRQKHGTDFGLR